VVVGPHDISAPVYGDGAFSLADFLGWSAMVSQQEANAGLVRQTVARVRGSRKVTAAYAELPLDAAAERLTAGRAPWYPQWVAHPDRYAPFWTPRSARAALARAEVPILLVGGWQDLFLRDTLAQYATLHARGADVALTVGPWTHIQTATSGGAVVARETLAWLDENLAGATARTRPAPVRIHVTGAGEWRELGEWPPPAVATVRHLGGGGSLGREPTDVSATFRYDPADPTPSVGGRLLQGRNGVRDNRALEARADVVTFTTEPLGTDVEVIGTPVVELEHATDNPHADVFVRLCDVDGTGRSANFSDALVRLGPSRAPGVLRVELDPCAHRLVAGHRLRLVVAGGAHPRWARNTGTAEPPAAATTLVPSTHTITGGRLTLPVVLGRT
jgi:putative CocE/NonD family hydrolase